MTKTKFSIVRSIKDYYPITYSKYLNKKYVVTLPDYLDNNEITDAVLFGKIPTDRTQGGLWSTNMRIIFLSHHILGTSFLDFSYDKIERISLIPSWPRSFVINLTGSGNFTLAFVEDKISRRFANHIRQKLSSISEDKTDTTNSVERNLLGELERLVKLHNDGFLSDTEFSSAKQKLLK